VLNNARGLRAGGFLRIDDDHTDAIYEVVTIVDAPGGSTLTEEAAADATQLSVQEAAVFHPGDIIIVGDETMEVLDAPASTALVGTFRLPTLPSPSSIPRAFPPATSSRSTARR